jgi:hypothetical protein
MGADIIRFYGRKTPILKKMQKYLKKNGKRFDAFTKVYIVSFFSGVKYTNEAPQAVKMALVKKN